MQEHYGSPKLGFPAGPTGLFPRFLEGYLIPAFTGHLNTSFKSKWAVSGWLYFQQLWKYVHPQSLTYNFMQDPLQSGEVLVAWDHVARITSAVRDHPNDYVVFPAPAGPKGRAYLPVLAGLAIPKTAPNAAGAKALIEYLDGVAPQARLPQVAGFFPVVAGRLSKQVGPGLLAIAAAIKTQQRSKDALASLLPVGLGASGRQLQPRLHRHVHADRRQQGGHQQGPRRRGPEAAGRAQRGGRAVLEAGPGEHGDLPGRSELARWRRR